MFRITDRRLGGGNRLVHYRPEVVLGPGTAGQPVVLIKGGIPRTAEGVAFSGLQTLLDLRRDLDEAIDLVRVSETQ